MLLSPFASYSQLDIVVNTNLVPIYSSDGDTLSTCQDSMIIFKAKVTKAGVDVIGAKYSWNFDNRILPTEIDLDSVTNIYEQGGGYRVKLKVTTVTDTGFTIIPIKIALNPNYSETKLDLPETQDGICLGSKAHLIGSAYPELWEDEPIYEKIETPRIIFDDNFPYNTNLYFDEFQLGTNYVSGNIDSIGLSIIHPNMGSLKIKLACETDTIILKDFSATNNAMLGDTLNDVTGEYFWSMNASTDMNNASAIDNIIPNSHYLPTESFDNLSACKLNGNWTIEIEDNNTLDSGFIYSWNIIFEESILPSIWSFKDTLLQYKDINGILYGTHWSGVNSGASSIIKAGDTISANTNVRPDVYGNNKYVFHVVNNWSCPHDTSTFVAVEKVSFTVTPENGEAKLETDIKNTTTWASEMDWDFGDKSPTLLTVDSEPFKHEFEEKGSYDIVLIATDETGCNDTDTVTIEVTVEPFKLDNIPNMFSPNEDTVNDYYKFKKEDVKGLKEFDLTIYNRWGQRVYHTNNLDEAINTGWDGRLPITKLKASPGIYFYVIKTKPKDEDLEEAENNKPKKERENIFEKRGTIHLFR